MFFCVWWRSWHRLLPLLSLMYFFNSLDRSNLGNAKTDGIDKDLHLVGNQYTVILAVFNVTFSVFDLPSNLLLKRYSGKTMLPSMMIGWYVRPREFHFLFVTVGS